MERGQLKVGVNELAGPAPGYLWNVWIIPAAFDQISKEFCEVEYWHLVEQMRTLASEKQPTHAVLLSIDKVEDFYELRDKGGVLGKCNARIFFAVDSEERAIVVLGGIKKQNNGPTPLGDKVLCRNRYRDYKNGEFDKPSQNSDE